MVSTWKTTQQGDPTWALRYAEVLLHHPHDLPRTALRYAIELLPEYERQEWMKR